MTEDVVIDPPETFTASVVPLLREYLGKLSEWKEQLRAMKSQSLAKPYGAATPAIVASEFEGIRHLFDRFKPAGQALARQVSGMVDQGRLTPLERVELQLRLAEFESALLDFPTFMNSYKP